MNCTKTFGIKKKNQLREKNIVIEILWISKCDVSIEIYITNIPDT